MFCNFFLRAGRAVDCRAKPPLKRPVPAGKRLPKGRGPQGGALTSFVHPLPRDVSMFKNGLNRMNGWQRLWFVLTCIALVFAVIYPYTLVYKIELPSEDYKTAVERE